MWRRNGVACDELLFLPGTPHEYRCISGSDSSTSIASGSGKDGRGEGESIKNYSPRKTHQRVRNLGREGGGMPDNRNDSSSAVENGINAAISNTNSSSLFSEGDAAAGAANPAYRRSRSHDAQERRGSCLEEANETETLDRERRPLVRHGSMEQSASLAYPVSPVATLESPASLPLNTSSSHSSPIRESPIAYITERAQSFVEAGLDMLVVPELRPSFSSSSGNDSRGVLPSSPNSSPSSQQKHQDEPTKVPAEVYDAEYAPSGPSVLGAALDLSLPVLFNFHMFVVLMKDHYKTEAEETVVPASHSSDAFPDEPIIDESTGKIDIKNDAYTTLTSMTPPQVPPKVLPLIFLSGTLVRSLIPRKQRTRFYKTIMQGTASVPFRPVNFRDAFVGDTMTSLVRPIADVVFTLCYYITAIRGFVTQKFDLDMAGYLVSNSVALHGWILPLVAMLPLWFRFLQTLRQAYDTGKRWPYLGNAFKYLTAGLVVLYGMTHSTGDRGVGWMVSFTAATIFQIVWDAVMDWELLVIVPKESLGLDGVSSSSSSYLSWSSFFPKSFGTICQWRCLSFISSLNPRWFPSRLLGCLVIPFRRRISQPIANVLRRLSDAVPSWNQIRLRPQRLFEDDTFYWRALFGNTALRFCWMMNFIPAYRVSVMDGSTQETFGGGTQSWSFVVLAVLEIFRRCVWGIIKVELETIKLTTGEKNDLTMASTADEYLREGMWNAWRKGSDIDDDETEGALSIENDFEFLERCQRKANSDQYSPLDGTNCGIYTKISADVLPKQTHRCLGLSVSNWFIHLTYLVELSLWPVSFLILSYYVILME